MEIEITIHQKAWEAALPNVKEMVRNAALAALVKSENSAASELCIVLGDDDLLHELNSKYCGRDNPTNVLAFRYSDGGSSMINRSYEILGDVIISLETASIEATSIKRSLREHLSHLVIHGVLHLLGYDHETDMDAQLMESIEVDALAQIGISNPYEIENLVVLP